MHTGRPEGVQTLSTAIRVKSKCFLINDMHKQSSTSYFLMASATSMPQAPESGCRGNHGACPFEHDRCTFYPCPLQLHDIVVRPTEDHQHSIFELSNRQKSSAGSMDSSQPKMAPQTSLFQVFLRLRPPMQQNSTPATTEPWLLVEQPTPKMQEDEEEIHKSHPTHITLQPPNDSRKRAIERFGFTKVFHEEASQLDVFEEISAVENIRNVLKNGRDGLIATLGVTGSGKVCIWSVRGANR